MAVSGDSGAKTERSAKSRTSVISDPAVLKNLAISHLAAGFRDTCRTAYDVSLPRLQRHRRALDAAQETLKHVELVAGPSDRINDPDVARMARLAGKAIQAFE